VCSSDLTLSIAQGAVEWVRMGKNADETLQLLTKSAQVAKIAGLDQAESTQYLTAIMN
jgi:hypothetical protein